MAIIAVKYYDVIRINVPDPPVTHLRKNKVAAVL